jgi:two-component system LytT family response regulator
MYALIVDDEKKARESLLQIIKLYCDDIDSTAEAYSVRSATKSIEEKKPDILFIDIQLGDGNGFDILEKHKNINVIFTTAYSDYAIKALKLSAIDYLLKPIDPDELIEAIERTVDKINEKQISQRLELFLENIESKSTRTKKITLKTVDNIYVVATADIIYCESEHSYTTFYLDNGQKIMVSKNLREYEDLLPKQNFMRTHQSFLVNLDKIVRYEKANNKLVMLNDASIPVATRKKEYLMKFFKNI